MSKLERLSSEQRHYLQAQELAGAVACLTPLFSEPELLTPDELAMEEAAALIQRYKYAALFVHSCFQLLRDQCRRIAQQRFWALIEPCKERLDEPEFLCNSFALALEKCHQELMRLQRHLTHVHGLLSRQRVASSSRFSDTKHHQPGPSALQNLDDCIVCFQELVHAVYFSCVPDWFHEFATTFFEQQLSAFQVLSKARHDEDDEDDEVPEMDVNRAKLESSRFVQRLCPALRELNWLTSFESALSSMLFGRIEDRLQQIGASQFECPVLPRMERWVASHLLAWLQNVLLPTESALYEQWSGRLFSYLYERLGQLRISELFDIIVDFPESRCALTDLGVCLSKTSLRAELLESLKSAIQKRLLHPGAMTQDIVSQYISCVRSLRLLDPSGLLVHSVVSRIRVYLRQRPDTVRVIVHALLDDSPNGLLHELEAAADRPAAHHAFDAVQHDDDDDDDSEAEENEPDGHSRASQWMPEPAESDAGSWWLRRHADVVSELIYIYGRADRFVDEYRSLLAERLLAVRLYDCEREFRHLELLKLRFGETRFHYCDVMVNDIGLSKRIDANIQLLMEQQQQEQEYVEEARSHSNKSFLASLDSTAVLVPTKAVHVTMISAEFWPPLRNEEMHIPRLLKAPLNRYAQQYETLKAPRELRWKANLGCADLVLSFDDGRSVELESVPPLLASVMLVFGQCSSPIFLADLAEEVGVERTLLKRRLSYWLQRRVLRVVSGAAEQDDGRGPLYGVIEDLADYEGSLNLTSNVRSSSMDWASSGRASSLQGSAVEGHDDDDDDDDVSGTACCAVSQGQQLLVMLESYVLGILPSSFGGFTLKRIDNILRSSFAMGSMSYSLNERELDEFLDTLVQEGKLECIDGLYKQRKKKTPDAH